MKLKLDITPDLVAAMVAEVRAGEKAATAAMREAGNLLVEFVELRLELVGEGNGLGHAILISWKLYSLEALILQELA